MKVRIKDGVKVWQGETLPSRIAERPEIRNYQSRTDLHEQDGFYTALFTPVPEGYTLTDESWAVGDDGTAVQSGTLVDTATKARDDMFANMSAGDIALASAFRAALRALFGESAETNRNITEEYVVGALLQLDPAQYDAKTADLMKVGFDKLAALSGDGTTWTLFETVGDLIPQ